MVSSAAICHEREHRSYQLPFGVRTRAVYARQEREVKAVTAAVLCRAAMDQGHRIRRQSKRPGDRRVERSTHQSEPLVNACKHRSGGRHYDMPITSAPLRIRPDHSKLLEAAASNRIQKGIVVQTDQVITA